MPRLGLFVVTLALVLAPKAQTADSLGASAPVHDLAEVQPEMIGGLAALGRAVVYPPSALARDIEGRVIVQFVVTAQGAIVDPVAVRSPDDALSQAALAALLQQRFSPGQIGGEPVAVRLTLPITFRIPDDAPPPSQLAPRPIAPSPPKESASDGEGFQPDSDGVYGVAQVQPDLIGGAASIRPEYPVDARRGGIQGRVIVQFVVNTVGEPIDLDVVESPHRLLSDAARDAVYRLRFTPGLVDGEPVKVRFSLPVWFRLR